MHECFLRVKRAPKVQMLLSQRSSLSKIGFHCRDNSVTGSGHRIISLSLYPLLDQLVMTQLSGSVILWNSNEVIHGEKTERKAKLVTACDNDKNTAKLLKSLENCYLSLYSDRLDVHINKTISFILIKVCYLMHDCSFYFSDLIFKVCCFLKTVREDPALLLQQFPLNMFGLLKKLHVNQAKRISPVPLTQLQSLCFATIHKKT